jgi:hypothetical protein
VWWDGQNLSKPRTDKRGTKWNFRVWHEVVALQRLEHVARVFFWDERQNRTGVVLLGRVANTHVRFIHSVIDKLVANSEFRKKHLRQLHFPLDRHYSMYGAFPEESVVLKEIGRQQE